MQLPYIVAQKCTTVQLKATCQVVDRVCPCIDQRIYTHNLFQVCCGRVTFDRVSTLANDAFVNRNTREIGLSGLTYDQLGNWSLTYSTILEIGTFSLIDLDSSDVDTEASHSMNICCKTAKHIALLQFALTDSPRRRICEIPLEDSSLS